MRQGAFPTDAVIFYSACFNDAGVGRGEGKTDRRGKINDATARSARKVCVTVCDEIVASAAWEGKPSDQSLLGKHGKIPENRCTPHLGVTRTNRFVNLLGGGVVKPL